MRHRFYSPELRRWLTRDPLGLEGGPNLYMYAALNPLVYYDPNGLCIKLAGGMAVGLAGSVAEFPRDILSIPWQAYDLAKSLHQNGFRQTARHIGRNISRGVANWKNTVLYGESYEAGKAVGRAAGTVAKAVIVTKGLKALRTASAPKSGGRVFWSGGTTARESAEAFARSSGGQTLEMTRTGRFLDAITTQKTYPYLKPAWNKASQSFARGADGAVDVFQSSQGVRLESVWKTVEYPELIKSANPINYHITP